MSEHESWPPTRATMNRLIELRILTHDPLDDLYRITELYSQSLEDALEHFDNNPHLVRETWEETLNGIILLAYLRTVKVAHIDEVNIHAAVIKSMFDFHRDRRLEEFGARLRLLERVKT